MVDRQNDIVFLMPPWHTVNPSYHNFISMSTRILKEDGKDGRVEGWKGEKFPPTIGIKLSILGRKSRGFNVLSFKLLISK